MDGTWTESRSMGWMVENRNALKRHQSTHRAVILLPSKSQFEQGENERGEVVDRGYSCDVVALTIVIASNLSST